MSRGSRAAPHLSLEAVEQKLKSTDSYWHRQKWLIVYNGLVDPRPASAIAKQTGVSVATVHKVISQYNQLGVAALETPGKGGRYNSYLTREQEKEFLGKFFEQAAKGQIPTVTQIKIAYEQLVGHPVHKTTIYRLLDRHQWRKIVPRPCHVKADPQEQEAFKKTFSNRSNKF
jgi:transposase